jgi:hypothetical protein
VDGRQATASYDPANDTLTYQSPKIDRGRHTVRIEATDGQGLTTAKEWKFAIVKPK